jgi:hypothetical protein
MPEPGKPLCESCGDAARTSFCNELRAGLRDRGFWAPERESDLLMAVFRAIDLTAAAAEARRSMGCGPLERFTF